MVHHKTAIYSMILFGFISLCILKVLKLSLTVESCLLCTCVYCVEYSVLGNIVFSTES